MKKILRTFILCSMLLVGCGGKTNTDQTNKNYIVGGSTSIQPVMEQLAEAYNKNQTTSISVQGGGSSVGTKGSEDGTFDVGMVSRALKSEEKEQLDETVIALDGIVLIANDANPVDNLTMDQIKKIYTGQITNWKEVGGKDEEIAVVSREEGSGTRDGFESIVGFETTALIPNAIIQNATGAIISNVMGNPQAIGYISLGSLSDNVKLLRVDGVKPSETTIKNNTYKLQRPFILCVKKGNQQADKIFDFIFSQEGEKIIQEYNYIPVERPNK